MDSDQVFCVTPIGIIASGYREKFGIPRQPSLVTEACSILTLNTQFSPETVRGLEQYSHIWLIFRFHAVAAAGWRPTVRPPRLGGNQRIGVFATRSTFRPNALGLSVVKLSAVQIKAGRVQLVLQGCDLLDGTPILDIKPYLPYVDAIPDAQGGFAHDKPSTMSVRFTALADTQCEDKAKQWQVNMRLLIEQILGQDPRPAYRTPNKLDQREYGMMLYDFDLRWCYDQLGIQVLALVDKPD